MVLLFSPSTILFPCELDSRTWAIFASLLFPEQSRSNCVKFTHSCTVAAGFILHSDVFNKHKLFLKYILFWIPYQRLVVQKKLWGLTLLLVCARVSAFSYIVYNVNNHIIFQNMSKNVII